MSRSLSYFNDKTNNIMATVEDQVMNEALHKLPMLLSLSTSGKITGKGNNSVCAWSTTPILSCPGSTEVCRMGCYGCTGNFRFPAVKTQQYRNLLIFSRLLNEGRQVPLVEGLMASIKNSPAYYAGQFRLFEVGDFYNQAVVETWTEVVNRMPETLFWAYTRSFHLNFNNLQDRANMCLFGSSDPENEADCKRFADDNGLRIAHALPKGETTPVKGSILCPQQTGVFRSCWDCGLCFKVKRSKNISFLYH
jgi:hypothetical protein